MTDQTRIETTQEYFFFFCSSSSFVLVFWVLFFKLCRGEADVCPLIYFKARSLLLKTTHGVDTKRTQRPPQQENHTLSWEWLICKCIKDLTRRKLERWCTVIYPAALNCSQTQPGCISCKWSREVVCFFWFLQYASSTHVGPGSPTL